MNTSLSRTIAGIGIIALGVGVLLGNIGLFNFGAFIGTYWPLIIVLVGLLNFMNNPKEVIVSLTIVVVGLLLQLRELNILEFDIWQLFWPAVLIGVGFAILFNRTRTGQSNETKSETTDLFALFSGIDSRNYSGAYKGGKLTAVAGGITLDLRDAVMARDATLDVFTFMGGVELRVPRGVHVSVSGMPIMGGWENKAEKPTIKNAPTLAINASCVMGGIEIKN